MLRARCLGHCWDNCVTVEPLKTDTQIRRTPIKRTPKFGPCHFFNYLLYFKSLKDGHLSKTDNGHLEIQNVQLKSPFHFIRKQFLMALFDATLNTFTGLSHIRMKNIPRHFPDLEQNFTDLKHGNLYRKHNMLHIFLVFCLHVQYAFLVLSFLSLFLWLGAHNIQNDINFPDFEQNSKFPWPNCKIHRLFPGLEKISFSPDFSLTVVTLFYFGKLAKL